MLLLQATTQPTSDPIQAISALLIAVAALLGALASIAGTVAALLLHFGNKASIKEVAGKVAGAAGELQAAQAQTTALNGFVVSHDEQLTTAAQQIGQLAGAAGIHLPAPSPAALPPMHLPPLPPPSKP